MKQLLCLLLALCLPLTALADTVAERVNAPETWQGEFQSNTGLTHVYVDMTIEVPEVDAFPIYAVEPRVFSMEDVTIAANQYLGEDNWQQMDSIGDPVEGELRYLVYEDSNFVFYDCTVRETGNPHGQIVWAAYNDRDGMPGVPDYSSDTVLECLDNRYDRGRDVGTLEEAVALADAFIAPLDPEMVFEFADPTLEGYGMRFDHNEQSSYGYRLYYVRKVSDILVSSVYPLRAPAEDIYTYVLPYERLWIDVGEGGVFGMRWDNPIVVKDVIAKDCELLPFEKIMDIFSTIAPLTIQATEYESNNNLYVKRAALSYICAQERGNPTSYQLIPVWDFFGARTIGREHYEEYNYALLTINAIDGTIIDRKYGY